MRVYTCHTFAGALVVTVSNEMFSGCCYLMVMLHAAYHFNTQFGNEVRRFPIYFLIASPTLVTADIEDGSIDIGISQHTGFPSGD